MEAKIMESQADRFQDPIGTCTMWPDLSVLQAPIMVKRQLRSIGSNRQEFRHWASKLRAFFDLEMRGWLDCLVLGWITRDIVFAQEWKDSPKRNEQTF